jgi:predicted RNA-binding Zn-ribbon protein involved in translation (DUF1610 family)
MSADPWRFRCPDCGSTTLYRRTFKPSGTRSGGPDGTGAFRCRGCGGTHGQLLDKKCGEVRTPKRGELS